MMRAALLLALLPAAAQAQTAHQTLDCRATLLCDAAGTCAPVDDPVPAFTLTEYPDAPTHTIAFGPIEADATVLAGGGVIAWTEGDGAHSILTTVARPSPTTATVLWQPVAPGTAAIRFLSCEVTP